MTTLSNAQRAFLEQNHRAAMITLRPDGMPHAVRVGVALVDDKPWSSGTQARARTRFLRADPRATLWVFDNQYSWLSIESTVTLLESPDAPTQSVRLFRAMQGRSSGSLLWNGKETEVDDFVRQMVQEQRLIYQFEPQRIYGSV